MARNQERISPKEASLPHALVSLGKKLPSLGQTAWNLSPLPIYPPLGTALLWVQSLPF